MLLRTTLTPVLLHTSIASGFLILSPGEEMCKTLGQYPAGCQCPGWNAMFFLTFIVTFGYFFLQILRGSFSAVSKPNFASKYSFESSWRDLQDLHAFAPLRPQYFRKFSSNFFAFFGKILQKFVIFEFFSLIFAQILMKFCRNFADILENVEIFRIFWIF